MDSNTKSVEANCFACPAEPSDLRQSRVLLQQATLGKGATKSEAVCLQKGQKQFFDVLIWSNRN